MSIQFSLGDPSKGTSKVTENGSSYILKYPCSNGSSCTFYQTILPQGTFLLEVWGSQGGNTNAGGVGGKGGYSLGILNITKSTNAFIHIGGQPANTPGGSDSTSNKVTIYGGYNGGGGAIYTSNCNGGGGGTDIRLNENTFYHRVIVAGGGGGGESFYYGYARYPAGFGGGLEGNYSGWGTLTIGGKQDRGGEGGYASNGGTQGSFGLGGIHGGQSAGGGGGWFGGSGSGNGGHNTGGGGGSGYVFNSSSYKPSGFKLTSEYYLTGGVTIQGSQTFLSPEGVNENGHSGHGAVRITVLGAPTIKQNTKDNCNTCSRNVAPKYIITMSLLISFIS
jgi:hypothetical protein